jgi:hypothetical protein
MMKVIIPPPLNLVGQYDEDEVEPVYDLGVDQSSEDDIEEGKSSPI